MRKSTPRIYRVITKFFNFLQKKDSIYIIDYLGGSFKDYISKYPMEEKLSSLVKGLDEKSKKTIAIIYLRLLNYPEKSFNVKINPIKNKVIGGLLDEEIQKLYIRKIIRALNLKLLKSNIESSIFYYYHGLKLLPKQVNKYVEEGDFIDVGAYIGESAVALQLYKYKKIFSIEMSQTSIIRYLKTLKANNISPEKFTIINYAIAVKDDLPPYVFTDSGAAGLSIKNNHVSKNNTIQVQRKSLDSIVNMYKIKPVFIKIDIEGAGMDCIIGGINTIKLYRPILSIAIYHNPIEFFEIKPYLESELSNYHFLIRKLSNKIHDNNCHAEVILLAYPKECTYES